ncbi:serine/threonine protein phosphatase PP2A-associated protein [Coprinopsis sp. MPI-PUGE-AT-0042]|nr:serine/threonine protein phosphatase PP2A-associated protein [Coprinopsis sp. MPI-PUGE-AT-0042]
MSQSQSLAAIYSTALDKISKSTNLPPGSEDAPELVSQAHRDLKRIHSGIIELGIFSPNETVEDVTTRDLIYLSLPWTLAEAQSRLKKESRSGRLESVSQAQQYLKSFISILEAYKVVSEEERDLYSKKINDVRDPAKKRELKINQYKKEKELKGRIETLRRRQAQKPTSESANLDSEFSLIASLLPSDALAKEEKELDTETDEILRETSIIVLRLLYAQAQTQAEMLERELEMLKMAPPSPTLSAQAMSQDERLKQREEEASMWRLDAPRPTGGPDGKGPLMDSSGRVLRPFTILPSDAGERQRLKAEVFGPGHNLPTMSVDELLEVERSRGKFLSGGGPASESEPTSKEQLAMDAEMDGTAEGESKAEEKRQQDEKWAQFTDANPRGAGNTMNRG